jgi:hypothetical protein
MVVMDLFLIAYPCGDTQKPPRTATSDEVYVSKGYQPRRDTALRESHRDRCAAL